MSQDFNTVDVLTLEVERTPEAGELFNELENPNGVLGGWGWVTPVPSTLMRGVTVAEERRLRFRTVAGTSNWFTSEPVPAQPGEWAAARWDANALSSGYHRGQVEFLNLEGVVIGTSGYTGYLITGTGTIAATQAPAQTTHVQLRIDVYADAAGGQPTGVHELDIRRAVLATADSEDALGNPVPYVPPAPYVDVLGPTHDLRITREDLNVGTLVATILDADLDPGTDDLIRPGRRTRLRLVTDDDENLEPLFTGRILTAQVTYALLARDERKRARISLTAVDAASPLGSIRRADGVAEIDHLPYVLEGAGVPWNVNGSGNQVLTATVAAVNDNASALDQVAITRDTVRGYAWVDRAGILQAWDRDILPTTVVDTLDETTYNTDAKIDYDLAGCINAVTVNVTRLNTVTGASDQVTFGPYRNEVSIAEFGLQGAEFTVHGIADDAVEAYAQSILDDNATPAIRIQQVTCPIATTDDLDARATRDLYDLVAVANERAGIDTTARVSGIDHVITPDKWLLTLTFAGNGAAAPPQSTPLPPLPPAVRPLAPTGLALETSVEIRAGQPYVTLAAAWEPVTQNTDDSALTNLDHYQLETKIGPAAGPNAWGPAASTAADVTEVTATGYPAGQVITARVRAVNTVGIGSDWSDPVTIGSTVDEDAPSQPSTPTTETRLGVIKIQWDGLTAGGLPMEDDFARLEVHTSLTSGFTPEAGDPNTLLETLFGPGYGLKTDGAYNQPWHFRLLAIDSSGNVSPPSVQVSAATQPLVDTDLIGEVISGANIVDGSITASDKIVANTITGGLIQAFAISAGKIASNAITADKIQAGAVTAVKIDAGAITADKIDSGAITAEKIASGTITADKIDTDVFSAITIDASQITSGSISGNRITGGAITGTSLTTRGGTLDRIFMGDTNIYGFTNNVITMTISGDGYFSGRDGFFSTSLEVNGITTSEKLHLYDPNTGANGVDVLWQSGTGQIVANTSSRRFKFDEEQLPIDLAAAYALEPKRSHRYDSDPDDWFVSFIAEDAEALGLEPWVVRDEDGAVYSFSYSNWTVAQQAMLRDLHARLTSIENQ